MKKIRNIVRLVSRMSFFLLVAETMFANNELNGNGKSDIKPYSGTFTHQASEN